MRWLAGLAKAARDRDAFLMDGERVVGHIVTDEALAELRDWLVQEPPKTVIEEQRAVIEACIRMAHANREIDPEERAELKELIAWSGLDEDVTDALVHEVHFPPPLGDLRERVRHPAIRDVLLALAWTMAMADGKADAPEKKLFSELVSKLGVTEEHADAIRRAVR